MLTEDEFKQVLPPQIKKSVNQKLIDSINSTLSDPEAMEIYKENLLTYTHVLQRGKFKLENYLNAVRYVSFKIMGMTNTNAYIKTFPDKYSDFLARNVSKKDIASYVTAYNKSKLVMIIYEQSLIPSHILNAPIFQQAVNVQASIMMDEDASYKVRSDAANSLMTHLKPPETTKMELDISVNQGQVIDDYQAVFIQMAKKQQELIALGGDIKAITNASIKPKEENIIDITPEPQPPTTQLF